uniref:Calcineurinlike phosphoesterase putative n=1 Tax=Albugo laibachii Nc14 TaxID=890382 RepID=F0WQH8_9STRA|nr:calcineurinlike phosphoesterase putative [Albugo laibachii Nc14]|eukprot:CCA23587.1 calcineurinlike phosphoesterase putative [Albugo laibachii Nc14]
MSKTTLRGAKLVILSINDVYEMYPNQFGQGGISELATLLQKEREKVPSDAKLLVTVNGDFLSGSMMAVACKGAHMIAIMNYLAVDFVVLGNHEFDFGVDTLLQRMSESRFRWFGSNVLLQRSQESEKTILPGVLDYKVLPLQDTGLKVGIFGVCTEATPQLSYPGDDVMFEDGIATAKRCVRLLKEEHRVDFVIALTHMSIEEDRALARNVPEINFILGGHDHEPFTLYEGLTLIHKSGQNANWLARFDFIISESPQRDGELSSRAPISVIPQWSMLANHNQQPDPTCLAIVDRYSKMVPVGKEDDCGLATLELSLSTRTSALRSGECNMANLVADALRHELQADVGFINGGFIRGDREYAPKTQITLSMLQQEMPFPKPAVIIKIKTGAFRGALLQQFALYPKQSGSHPHVSGVSVTYDRRQVPNTISIKSESSGEELDDNVEIRVATSMFVAEGRDGCASWLEGVIVAEKGLVSSVVCDFLVKQRIVAYVKMEKRIEIFE